MIVDTIEKIEHREMPVADLIKNYQAAVMGGSPPESATAQRRCWHVPTERLRNAYGTPTERADEAPDASWLVKISKGLRFSRFLGAAKCIQWERTGPGGSSGNEQCHSRGRRVIYRTAHCAASHSVSIIMLVRSRVSDSQVFETLTE